MAHSAPRRYNDLDEQQMTYRDLQTFLASDLFEPEYRRNSSMKLLNFDKVKPPGIDDKLDIPIENVTAINDTLDFCRRLESFRPGTKVRSTQGAASGIIRYTVHVPWRNPANKRYPIEDLGDEDEYDPDAIISPNPMRLFLWNLVAAGLLAVAWKTTTWAEWVAFSKFFYNG